MYSGSEFLTTSETDLRDRPLRIINVRSQGQVVKISASHYSGEVINAAFERFKELWPDMQSSLFDIIDRVAANPLQASLQGRTEYFWREVFGERMIEGISHHNPDLWTVYENGLKCGMEAAYFLKSVANRLRDSEANTVWAGLDTQDLTSIPIETRVIIREGGIINQLEGNLSRVIQILDPDNPVYSIQNFIHEDLNTREFQNTYTMSEVNALAYIFENSDVKGITRVADTIARMVDVKGGGRLYKFQFNCPAQEIVRKVALCFGLNLDLTFHGFRLTPGNFIPFLDPETGKLLSEDIIIAKYREFIQDPYQ